MIDKINLSHLHRIRENDWQFKIDLWPVPLIIGQLANEASKAHLLNFFSISMLQMLNNDAWCEV